ncbi:MAG TPA: hypothetical protein DCL15_18355 [Chloroflexi bacterium]|nr:hypothetical protein [Chloroflexota bacterium]
MEKPQPAYRPELFVNHADEIELVEQAVREALARKPRRTRAITFYGERGSGKTWLSRHLGTALPHPPDVQAQAKRVKVLTLFLAPPKAELDANASQQHQHCYFYEASSASCQSPDQIVLEMLHWVCQRWEVTYDEQASAADLIYWLGRDLPQHDGVAFVLIVDSVFEFGKGNERLPLLEDQLLTPVASLDNGLVVMTGRGAPFPWRSVPLRQESVEKVLPPFHAQDVGEQLARCAFLADPARAARIHALGGGYPLNTHVLGQADPPEAELEELVDALLDFVQSGVQRSVREALEALCVLDRFREREIAIMMARHRAESNGEERSEGLSMEDARSVRDLLLDNYLMRWQGAGYVINESVRVAYRSYLQYHKPTLFAALGCRAIEMYRTWSENYPNAEMYYRRQAEQLGALLASVNALHQSQ